MPGRSWKTAAVPPTSAASSRTSAGAIGVARKRARDLQRLRRTIAERHDPARGDAQVDVPGEVLVGHALQPFPGFGQHALLGEIEQAALGVGLRQRVLAGSQRVPARVVKALPPRDTSRRRAGASPAAPAGAAARTGRAGNRVPARAAGPSRAFRRRSGSAFRASSCSM